MFLEPKDFAKAIGISYATLRKHIQRKKVYKSGDLIDTDYELNKPYIITQTNGKGLDLSKINAINEGQKKVSKPKNIEEPKKPEPKEPPKTKIVTNEERIQLSLELQQKEINLEKAKNENELKRIEIAKRSGELMPLELVEKIFSINIQTLLRTIENENENLASVWLEILGGDRSHLSKMIKEMREIIQRSVSETEEKSAEDIKTAIKDYAEVRGRGQRK